MPADSIIHRTFDHPETDSVGHPTLDAKGKFDHLSINRRPDGKTSFNSRGHRTSHCQKSNGKSTDCVNGEWLV